MAFTEFYRLCICKYGDIMLEFIYILMFKYCVWYAEKTKNYQFSFWEMPIMNFLLFFFILFYVILYYFVDIEIITDKVE